MLEREEFFADRLRQINLLEGMVRYDFSAIRSGEDSNTPFAEEKLRIIMPLQGFLNAYDSMQELIGKLIKAGVLQKSASAKPAKPARRTGKTAKTSSAAKAAAKPAATAKPRTKKK